MLVYLDKEFAQNFEEELLKMNPLDQPEENEVVYRLFELFRKFPDLEVYSNANQEEKSQIRLFRYILNLNAVIRSEDQFVFELGKSNKPLHLLAFTSKRHQWASQFEEKGGLYFETKDYVNKISKILNYEAVIRFIELKKPFTWNDIAFITHLPVDEVHITDNYLISSKLKRDHNLKPLLRMFSRLNNPDLQFQIIVNKDKLQWGKSDWEDFEEEIEDFINDEDLQLNFELKSYNVKVANSKLDFHDRKMFLKYLKIEVGKGFDLLPYNSATINDKKITIGTIFNKETYDDFRSYYSLLKKV